MSGDIFDILNGNDGFPLLNQVSKESFSGNIENIIKEKKEDGFNVDDFLYKNFRFNSLNSLYKELSTLNSGLNDELLNLVNEDYHDFIKLGKSINNENFVSILNTIKYNVNNYKKILEIQQKENFQKNYNQIKEGLKIKRKIFFLKNQVLEIIVILNKLISNFQSILNSKDFNRSGSKKQETLELLENGNLDEFDFSKLIISDGEEETNVNSMEDDYRELTRLYLSINQLEESLVQTINIAQVQKKKDNNQDNHGVLTIPKADVVDDINQLNSMTIDDLLESGTSTVSSDDSVLIGFEKFPYLEEQLHKVNHVRLEYQSIKKSDAFVL